MELRDVIYGRRSIRSYQETDVSTDDLREILEAGLMAPNGMNLQQWHFVMIRDPKLLSECKELMTKVYHQFKPVLQEKFILNPSMVDETGKFLSTLGNAPAMLLAFVSHPGLDDSLSVISSICAAIENMLLAAYDKGLGSCWLTAPIVAKMDHEFKERFAPDKGKLVACVLFGYPNEAPPSLPRKAGRYEIL